MKKTLLLLFSLLTTVGMWAEDVTSYSGEFYYIHNNNNTNKYVGSAYQCQTSQSYGALFRIKQVTHNDATCYTIYNMNTGKYVNYKDTNEGTTKLEGGSLGDKSYWDIEFVDGTAVTICPQGGSNSWNFWGGNSDPNPVGLYRSSDGNSKWRLEKITPVSSASGLSEYKYGVISIDRGGWAVSGASATSLSSTHDVNIAVAIDTKQQFAFVPYDDKYYLYSVAAGKFVKMDGSLTLGAGDPITFVSTGDTNYPILIKFDDSHCINLGGSSQMVINDWGDISSEYDQGNKLALLPEGDYSLTAAKNVLNGTTPPISVKYEVYFNGTKANETTIETLGGYAPSLPATLTRDFCTYNYFSDLGMSSSMTTLPTTNCTVYVNMTWNGPFTISSDFASAKWYLLRMKDGTKNMKYQDGSAAYPLEDVASYDIAAEDYYSWAFLGNPYDLKIVNKQAGSTKKFYKGSSVGNGGVPTMSDENESSWTITRGTADTNFGISPNGHSYYLNAWNGGATVQFYSSGPGSDPGSRLTVMAVEDIDFTSMVTSYIKPYIDNPSNAYFAVTSDNVATLLTNHAEGGSKTSWTKAEYQSYYADLQDAIAKPTAGYYVLKNVNSGAYLTYNGTGTANGANNTAAAIIKLTPSGSGYTLQMQGAYLKVPNYQDALTTQSDPDVFYATIANSTPGQVKIGTDAGAHTYLNYTGGVVQGSQPSTNTGWWILEDAPSSVSVGLNSDGVSTNYATLCTPFSYTVGDGVTAYTLEKSASGNYLIPTSIDGEVTAGTPVLLKGTSDAATLTLGTGYAATPLSTTSLTGTYTNLTVAKTDDVSDDYYLGINSGVVGFYKWDGSTLGANRAYLPKATAEAAVKGFSIRWADETGVESIEHSPLTIDHEAGAMFDLSGRRVNKAQKGLYIHNGKKVVIK